MKNVKLILSLFIFSLILTSCTDLENEELEQQSIENTQSTGGENDPVNDGSKD